MSSANIAAADEESDEYFISAMDSIKTTVASWIREHCNEPDALFAFCNKEDPVKFDANIWRAKSSDHQPVHGKHGDVHHNRSILAAYISDLDVRDIITMIRAAKRHHYHDISMTFVTLILESCDLDNPKHVALACSALHCWVEENTISGLEAYCQKRQWIMTSHPKLWRKILERDSIVRPICQELARQLDEINSPTFVQLVAQSSYHHDSTTFSKRWLDECILGAASASIAKRNLLHRMNEITIPKLTILLQSLADQARSGNHANRECFERVLNELLASADESSHDHIALARGAMAVAKASGDESLFLKASAFLHKYRPKLHQSICF